MSKTSALHVEGHFDPVTWTVSYIVLGHQRHRCQRPGKPGDHQRAFADLGR
ncbi:MAG: hypothetical protein RL364_339 [Pseudomonadota bacterium]